MGNYYRAALPITHSDIHIPDPHSIGFIGKDANSASGGRMLSRGDGLMMFIIICLIYVVFITYHNMFNIFYHKILLYYDIIHMIHIFDRMSCTLGTLASWQPRCGHLQLADYLDWTWQTYSSNHMKSSKSEMWHQSHSRSCDADAGHIQSRPWLIKYLFLLRWWWLWTSLPQFLFKQEMILWRIPMISMILLSFFCGRPDAPDASTASPASDRRPLGDAAQFQTDADPRGRRKSFQTGTPRHDSTQTKKNGTHQTIWG